MLSESRNGERRALLLERALAGGADLEAALQQAAQAELWLTGALTSAKVLGVKTGYLALPAPEPARADTAGGVVPAKDRVSHPTSEESPEPAAPEAPESGRPQDSEQRVLAAIAELGPEVRNPELCVAAGVTVWHLKQVLPALQSDGRLRVEGYGKSRRLLLPGAEPPPRKRYPRPLRVSDETLERVLAGVRRLGPGASNGHLAALLGINSVTVSTALAKLVEAGRLKRRVEGRQRQLEIVGERWETAEEAMARGVAVTRCPPAYAAPVTGAEEKAGRLPHYDGGGDWKAQRDAAMSNSGVKR